MKIGVNDIADCKIGSTQVNKVYLGSNLVWEFGGGLDPLTTPFLTANGITDPTYSSAVNTMFASVRSAGLLSNIQAWWIFYGNATQSKYNALSPVDADADFRLTFYGGGTIDGNGWLTNGTNAYADTHFLTGTTQSVNSNGFTLISGTNNTPISGDPIDMGVLSLGSSFVALKNGGVSLFRLNNFNLTSSNTDAKGIFTATKQSATVSKLIRNNTVIANGNSGGTSLAVINMYIGTLNLGSPYSSGWSNQRLQQALMHNGMSDADVGTLQGILDTFENALGRKTW